MSVGELLQFEAIPVATPTGAPLAVELVPAPDPWDIVLRLAHLPNLLFLDSAEKHATRGRYSFIAADTSLEVHSSQRNGRIRNQSQLHRIAEKLPAISQPTIPGLPPFQGGLGVMFGYELGRTFECLPQTKLDEFQNPEWAVALYDWVISFDHDSQRAWIISTGHNYENGHGTDPERARSRIVGVLNLLRQPEHTLEPHRKSGSTLWPLKSNELAVQYPLAGYPGVTSNFDRAQYETAVQKVVDYIHAGDCFQVNLSQRLLAPLREHPLELYGRLRKLNPAPFAGYFDIGDFQILSASPERFLRLSHGEVETRPIKGTRPRGRRPEEDEAFIRDLTNNPKDRAENVMIVDLLRNDLGKVCEYGSVQVPQLCEVETFQFVHHLVSMVRGKLRSGVGPLDLITATFPGGSVTGAPKVRAMEIIAELEPTARGPYCGCLGWIGFNGSADLNILIRTFTAGRGWVQFPVGGGIVADSDPAREYEETLHKAAGLLRALM